MAKPKFRLSPRAIEAVKASTTITAVCKAAGKPLSTWSWLVGRVQGRDGQYGVVLETYQAFCRGINQCMGWDKSLEEICHPEDRSKLLAYWLRAKGADEATTTPDSPGITDSENGAPHDLAATSLQSPIDDHSRTPDEPRLDPEHCECEIPDGLRLTPQKQFRCADAHALPAVNSTTDEYAETDLETAGPAIAPAVIGTGWVGRPAEMPEHPDPPCLEGPVPKDGDDAGQMNVASRCPTPYAAWQLGYVRASYVVGLGAAVVIFTAGLLASAILPSVPRNPNPPARDEQSTSPELEHVVHGPLRRAELRIQADAAKANALLDFVCLDALGPPAADTPQHQHISHRDKLVDLSTKTGARFGHDPLVEARIRMALGAAFLGYREYELAEAEFQLAVDLRTGHLGPDHLATLEAKYHLADAYIHLGKAARAVSLASQVVQARQRDLGDIHPATVSSRDQLGRAYWESSRYEQAVKIWEPLLDQMEAHRWEMNRVNHVKRSLATAYQMLSQAAKAEALFLEVLEEQRERLGGNHAETLFTMHQLACHYCGQGELESAERIQREVLEHLENTWGPEGAQALQARGCLAVICSRMGRFEEAEALYLQTIAGEQRLSGPHRPGNLVTLRQYATLLRSTGRFDEAEAMLRYAIAGQAAQYGDAHPMTVSSLYSLASVFRFQQLYGRELLWQVRTLIARYRLHGSAHPETVNTRQQFVKALHGCAVQLLTRPWYDTASDAGEWFVRPQPRLEGMPLVVMDGSAQRWTFSFVQERPADAKLAVKESSRR